MGEAENRKQQAEYMKEYRRKQAQLKNEVEKKKKSLCGAEPIQRKAAPAVGP
jgi:hypothetical protein